MGFVVNKRRFKQSAPSQYSVTITINSNINHTGGALIQTNLSGPMTPVTLSPKDTYRINQPSGGSGITVTASGNNFVISGTPIADVTINCTTTQNPDLLTATQKDISTWTKTWSSATHGYQQEVSDTRINWNIPSTTLDDMNEAYYTTLYRSTVPTGNYILEIRYRITDLSQLDTGCKIGISGSNYHGTVNRNFISSIDILDTQTTYTNVSVPFTRGADGVAVYLAITNQYWNLNNTLRQGRIYLASISLRAV